MALPRIIGGICEHCGIKAVVCPHAVEFKAAGMLVDEASRKFEEKLLIGAPGLPEVRGGICTFCGVYFLDERCQHLADRRKAVFGDAEAKDDTVLVSKDTSLLEAEENARKDAARALETGSKPVTTADLPVELGGEGKAVEAPAEPKVEASGDAAMDALMDAGDPPPVEVPPGTEL